MANNLKKYNGKEIINKINPYISICISVFNMEKFFERNLLSLINQTFQHFEIIIVNDNSSDDSEKKIEFFQIDDKRIKIINHFKNLGVYCSRVNAAYNTGGKYIVFIKQDDIVVNPNLFEGLFIYNLKYNLDIIEFSVYHKEEGKRKNLFPYYEFNQYHIPFKKIYQPELSDIFFYNQKKENYEDIFQRTILNKLIRKSILINSIKYIEKSFHNLFFITFDGTPLNILNFNYASNYSFIQLSGYFYYSRKKNKIRIYNDNSYELFSFYNYLLYFQFFFKYIFDFKKDFKFILNYLKFHYFYNLHFKDLNDIKYLIKKLIFFNGILKNCTINTKKYINNLLLNLIN